MREWPAADFEGSASRTDTEDRLCNLGSTRAHEPCQLQDFAGVQFEADAMKLPAIGHVVYSEDHARCFVIFGSLERRCQIGVDSGQLASHHETGKPSFVDFGGSSGADGPPVAQNDDSVRQFVNFLHEVRDVNECVTTLAQAPDHIE